MFDQAEWLREAVSKFEGSQAELGRQVAARLGLTEDRSRLNKSLKLSKNGKARKLTLAELVAISEITHHPLPAGYNEEEGRTVTVVGIAAAGSDTISYAEGQGHLDEVPAPHGSNEHTVAVEVRGGSLGPVFEGWLAFYDDRRDPPTDDLMGHMCIVGLASGQVVIRYAGDNPNGSAAGIAGICNAEGNVVGLMPHPEHAVDPLTGPSADGLGFFTSVVTPRVMA